VRTYQNSAKELPQHGRLPEVLEQFPRIFAAAKSTKRSTKTAFSGHSRPYPKKRKGRRPVDQASRHPAESFTGSLPVPPGADTLDHSWLRANAELVMRA
jgi:hypothetical protein